MLRISFWFDLQAPSLLYYWPSFTTQFYLTNPLRRSYEGDLRSACGLYLISMLLPESPFRYCYSQKKSWKRKMDFKALIEDLNYPKIHSLLNMLLVDTKKPWEINSTRIHHSSMLLQFLLAFNTWFHLPKKDACIPRPYACLSSSRRNAFPGSV